jgi:hypothetical protein
MPEAMEDTARNATAHAETTQRRSLRSLVQKPYCLLVSLRTQSASGGNSYSGFRNGVARPSGE